jgi:mannitol 2-dehydrogenase
VCAASLDAIAQRGIPVPGYDRSRLEPRIVHVGVGGFHRAHLALYTDELASGGSTWGIRGLGLLGQDALMKAALGPQDCLYTLTEKDSGAFAPRVVGSLVDYVLAPDDLDLAASVVAGPEVAIVSLTVTEAGYQEPDSPQQRTTFDVLAGCLARRQALGLDPLTILSCDNLPGNGDVARRAMLAAAARHSVELSQWIEASFSFPNSMVDRITPATAEADRQWLLDTYGVQDQRPVVSEPFRQWVIEDNFVAGRPAWEEAGVVFSLDVHAWELYKLRMLNAGHSCMAYLCSLAGITYVDEAMGVQEVSHYLSHLLHEEALPTLKEIPGNPRQDYIATVLQRFANTGVRDQIARLCIDGTAKFPTFLIPTIVRQLELGGPIERATLALAAWARYLAVTPPDEQSFDASGGIAGHHARRAVNDPAAFLDFSEVFPPALGQSPRFRDVFVAAARRLHELGPLSAMMA